MTERFRKAYDSLVRAFFEGTLAKATCMACACGNIIFDAIGDPVTKRELNYLISWSNSYGIRAPRKHSQSSDLWAYKRTMKHGGYFAYEDVKDEINQAGYTAEEFATIETAFEFNTKIHFSAYNTTSEEEILEDQYNGLCAVVDVLIELDKGKEDSTELKKKFREHPKLQIA